MPAAAAETGGERTEVEPSSRWARVDGLWMHYRTAGEVAIATRPAVVLVHGLVVSSRYMVPTLKRLARDYRVYAPDLPGFGESEKLPDSLDVPGLSSALSAWMDAVGLKQVVLQAPTMDPCGRSVPRQVARFLLDVPREPLSLVPIELLDLLAAGARRGWRTLRYGLEDRIEENLPHLRSPTLILRGSRDPICPQRWAEEATRLVPKGRLVVLHGAAHAANFGASTAFADVIRDFLKKERGG
jgi:2-hydroxy-6-oxonona-2,4-dienedioate hydrolase